MRNTHRLARPTRQIGHIYLALAIATFLGALGIAQLYGLDVSKTMVR